MLSYLFSKRTFCRVRKVVSAHILTGSQYSLLSPIWGTQNTFIYYKCLSIYHLFTIKPFQYILSWPSTRPFQKHDTLWRYYLVTENEQNHLMIFQFQLCLRRHDSTVFFNVFPFSNTNLIEKVWKNLWVHSFVCPVQESFRLLQSASSFFRPIRSWKTQWERNARVTGANFSMFSPPTSAN